MVPISPVPIPRSRTVSSRGVVSGARAERDALAYVCSQEGDDAGKVRDGGRMQTFALPREGSGASRGGFEQPYLRRRRGLD